MGSLRSLFKSAPALPSPAKSPGDGQAAQYQSLCLELGQSTKQLESMLSAAKASVQSLSALAAACDAVAECAAPYAAVVSHEAVDPPDSSVSATGPTSTKAVCTHALAAAVAQFMGGAGLCSKMWLPATIAALTAAVLGPLQQILRSRHELGARLAARVDAAKAYAAAQKEFSAVQRKAASHAANAAGASAGSSAGSAASASEQARADAASRRLIAAQSTLDALTLALSDEMRFALSRKAVVAAHISAGLAGTFAAVFSALGALFASDTAVKALFDLSRFQCGVAEGAGCAVEPGRSLVAAGIADADMGGSTGDPFAILTRISQLHGREAPPAVDAAKKGGSGGLAHAAAVASLEAVACGAAVSCGASTGTAPGALSSVGEHASPWFDEGAASRQALQLRAAHDREQRRLVLEARVQRDVPLAGLADWVYPQRSARLEELRSRGLEVPEPVSRGHSQRRGLEPVTYRLYRASGTAASASGSWIDASPSSHHALPLRPVRIGADSGGVGCGRAASPDSEGSSPARYSAASRVLSPPAFLARIAAGLSLRDAAAMAGTCGAWRRCFLGDGRVAGGIWLSVLRHGGLSVAALGGLERALPSPAGALGAVGTAYACSDVNVARLRLAFWQRALGLSGVRGTATTRFPSSISASSGCGGVLPAWSFAHHAALRRHASHLVDGATLGGDHFAAKRAGTCTPSLGVGGCPPVVLGPVVPVTVAELAALVQLGHAESADGAKVMMSVLDHEGEGDGERGSAEGAGGLGASSGAVGRIRVGEQRHCRWASTLQQDVLRTYPPGLAFGANGAVERARKRSQEAAIASPSLPRREAFAAARGGGVSGRPRAWSNPPAAQRPGVGGLPESAACRGGAAIVAADATEAADATPPPPHACSPPASAYSTGSVAAAALPMAHFLGADASAVDTEVCTPPAGDAPAVALPPPSAPPFHRRQRSLSEPRARHASGATGEPAGPPSSPCDDGASGAGEGGERPRLLSASPCDILASASSSDLPAAVVQRQRLLSDLLFALAASEPTLRYTQGMASVGRFLLESCWQAHLPPAPLPGDHRAAGAVSADSAAPPPAGFSAPDHPVAGAAAPYFLSCEGWQQAALRDAFNIFRALLHLGDAESHRAGEPYSPAADSPGAAALYSHDNANGTLRLRLYQVDRLLARLQPELVTTLRREGLDAVSFAPPHLMTLLTSFALLPQPAVAAAFDRFLVGGWAEVLSPLVAVFAAIPEALIPRSPYSHTNAASALTMEALLPALQAPRAYLPDGVLLPPWEPASAGRDRCLRMSGWVCDEELEALAADYEASRPTGPTGLNVRGSATPASARATMRSAAAWHKGPQRTFWGRGLSSGAAAPSGSHAAIASTSGPLAATAGVASMGKLPASRGWGLGASLRLGAGLRPRDPHRPADGTAATGAEAARAFRGVSGALGPESGHARHPSAFDPAGTRVDM